MKAKVVNGNSQAAAAAQPNDNASLEFTRTFIEKGGFKFISSMFTKQSPANLHSSTLLNKSLTLLVELTSQFMSSKFSATIKSQLTEQIIFDIFNQNLEIIMNFI